MYIDALSSNLGQGYSTSDDTDDKTVGKDEFLTLLLAQIEHQDPLNPLEGTEFTAQLAQFSSLEQLCEINKTLTEIQSSLGTQESGDILDYIGKVVKANDNALLIDDGKASSSTYGLEDEATVTIYIYDEAGSEVRRIYKGWQDAGEHNLDWDGRDNYGNLVDDGRYTFEIEAMGDNGLLLSGDTYVTGEVTGVTYQGEDPYLMIGDRLVTPQTILEVKQSESTE